MRPALHRVLVICKAYDVVANIWVLIPCTAGTPFRCINEKLGAETGDLAVTYKLVVAAVGLCRHAVRVGGGFSWDWSTGNELWDLVVACEELLHEVWQFLLFGLNRNCGTTIGRSRGGGGRVLRQNGGNVQEGHRSGTRSRLPSSVARYLRQC